MSLQKCKTCAMCAMDLGSMLVLQKVLGHDLRSGVQWPHLARVLKTGDLYHMSRWRIGEVVHHETTADANTAYAWYRNIKDNE